MASSGSSNTQVGLAVTDHPGFVRRGVVGVHQVQKATRVGLGFHGLPVNDTSSTNGGGEIGRHLVCLKALYGQCVGFVGQYGLRDALLVPPL